MKIVRKAAGKFCPRLILTWLALMCVFILPLTAQSPNNSASPTPPDQTIAIYPIHGTMNLESPWRFQIGDDPLWADPKFDDSSWSSVSLSQSLSEQGLESYTGYAWYRIRVQPQQLSQFSSLPGAPGLGLLITGNSVGQIEAYVDGVEVGHTRGMTDSPTMYQSPPFAVPLIRPSPGGTIVIAIRTWAGPRMPVTHGLLAKVELGTQPDVAERLALEKASQWDQHEIAGLVLSFLFLGVAILGTVLYISQRHHSEYLWMALLCLSVTVTGVIEFTFRQAIMPFALFNVMILFAGRIFMAVTLEFVLRFTASEYRRIIRIVQGSVLLVPFFSLLHLQQIYEYLSICAEVVFCALVSFLLYRAWRRGRLEAGVMLIPFFLASTADSIDTILDYAASKHWIADRFTSHRFHLGPIELSTSIVTYTVFLGSLIAVILYRFVRVSQEEQRSAAEIEAARNVQALLIPTQLPSNRHFMLESAYVPVNGVGGDFFQVLPLKDESLLIVVGDVSGKGLQAAMNASSLVGALRNELSHDPATVLNHLNQVMLGTSSGSGNEAKPVLSFATCLCARVYTDGTMTIANAGHLSPYRDGREMELAADLPLGVIAHIGYTQATFKLDKGDRLIFLSDGVVEATNSHGELFGFERTQQVSNEPARYIAQTAKHFGQNDDITVVSLYIASTAALEPAKNKTA